MRQILTSLVLVGMLLVGFWPVLGMAEEPLEQDAPAAIVIPPAFTSFTAVSGLTDPRGVVAFVPFPTSDNWKSGYYVVEKSLNRVSFAPQRGTPVPFTTTLLSNPTDLVAPRGAGAPWGISGTPNTNFLYVAEVLPVGGRISKIDINGVVTTFANLPAAPERMAFSNTGGGSTFTDFLFVTLADGQVVKVDTTGTVTSCLTGLSGPKGLVFGPGGALRTTTLYVVQSTANKISKVESACTSPVSDFATGLSAPVGLAISPAPPWGPLDTTLYVSNATTTLAPRVDRVDKTATGTTVTQFASGFTQADAVRFDSFMPVDDRLNSNLRVVDLAASAAGAGTIVEVNVLRPSVALTLTCNPNPCQAGGSLSVSLTLTNPGPIPVPVELKTGFQLFDGTPLNFSNSVINKHLETAPLAPGFSVGPVLLFNITWPGAPTIPPGRYCYQASLTDPEISIRSFSNFRTCFVSAP